MARLIEQPYDSTRKGERDARLRACLVYIKEPLEREDFDRVENEISRAYRDLMPMATPLPAPDPMERVGAAAIRMGWLREEIDILSGFVRRGRKVGRVTWKDVEIDNGPM